MADQKISELTALTGANLADVDAFAVVDTSAVQTKKITYAELKTALDTGTGFVRITGDTMTGNLIVPQVEIGDGSAGGTSELLFSDNVSARGKIKYNHGSNPEVMTLETTGTVAITIDNSQNVGINATPTQKLHVGGNAIITGLTRIGNGTATSPAYQFVDDTNTGMYRSSSDVLGFSTGGGNRLTLNSTGATFAGTVTATGMGIGDDTPTELLEIAGSSDPTLLIRHNTADNASSGKISFRENAGGTTGVDLRYDGSANNFIIDTSDVPNAFVIQRTTGYATFAGTVTSGELLSSVGLKVAGHPVVGYASFDSGYATRLGSTGSSTLNATQIYAGGSVQATFKGGNVAIGHTSSNALLQVSSGSGEVAGSQANPALQIGATTGYRLGMYTDAEGGYIENKNGDNGIIFKVKTAGEAMRIDGGTGNVGIGTSSPEHDLHVKTTGQTQDGIIKIGGSDASLGLEISYDQASVTTTKIISNPTYTHTGALMHIAVDGDANPNQLVLKGDGTVAVGTNNPVAEFAVGGAGRRIEIAGSDGVIRGFNRSASWASIDFEALSYNFDTEGSLRWSIDSNGNTNQAGGDSLYSGGGNWDFKHTIGGQNIVFSTTTGGGSTGEILRITNDGTLTLADNKVLKVSSSSTSAAFMQMTDTGSTTYEMLFPSSSSLQLKTHTTSDRTLSLYNSGAGAFDLEVNGQGTFNYTTSSTNTMLSVLKVQAASSGTAVANHGGAIAFLGQRNDGAAQTLAQVGAVASTNSGTSIAGDLVFHTGSGGAPSERMRLDENGKLGVGTNDPEEEIHAFTSSSCSIRASGEGNNNRKVEIGYDTADGPNVRAGSSGIISLKFYVDNTTLAGKFHTNADFYTNDGTVHSLSDIRVKTDVKDLDDGLDIVKQLKPRTFKYTKDSEFYTESKKDEISYGFVANEVEEVAPQYTDTGKGKIGNKEVDDLKSLSTTKMIPMLVKAIQEQQEIIESLTARITTLEGNK